MRKIIYLLLLAVCLAACSSSAPDQAVGTTEAASPESVVQTQPPAVMSESISQEVSAVEIHPVVTEYLASLNCCNSHVLSVRSDELAAVKISIGLHQKNPVLFCCPEHFLSILCI